MLFVWFVIGLFALVLLPYVVAGVCLFALGVLVVRGYVAWRDR